MKNPKHRWIAGYERLYSVGVDGTVYSHTRLCAGGRLRKGRFLAQGVTKDGYRVVTLTKYGKKHTYPVHRLVAQTWIPNPYRLAEVNHKDEIKSNNPIHNLEWCTHQYNSAYSKAKDYILTSPTGETVRFTNMARFCKENSLNRGSIHQLLIGAYNQHKGWTRSKADCG